MHEDEDTKSGSTRNFFFGEDYSVVFKRGPMAITTYLVFLRASSEKSKSELQTDEFRPSMTFMVKHP